LLKNNNICAHYNCDDLSRLEEFEDLKSQLNNVNKANATIGKPLIINDSFVYLSLRDILLLAPLEKLLYVI
jgi:hypothetical protein